ncbi:sugar ABC transporter ATP-binding protein [Oceaniradius stylonematis]|uniref:sugar ABC transporter ATP-binding protein n=1 Tax=Oceaniradius stylonematis TaxID=2184161 RepID=UPI00273D9112|nr:sugar ABC transporter ATP-binding protein [Oceaniradius stylonematis]
MAKLQVRGARKAYGATIALKRGDMVLESGEVHVLIGSNGSGKSTLCKIIAGSVRPDAGEVIIDGRPVTVTGPQMARELGIGIFYQELSLAAHRTVAENISLARLPANAGVFVDHAAVTAAAERYMAPFADVLGDGFAADTPVVKLRADQRQLVEIMKTLATEAPVLIFDEPTSALDSAQVERFFDVLRKLRGEGRSIIFISHRMDEIFAIGDRVTIMRDGETVTTMALSDADHDMVIRAMVGGQEALIATGNADDEGTRRTGKTILSVQNISGPGFSEISFSVAAGEIVGFGGLHGQGQSSVLRALFGASRRQAGTITLNGTPYTATAPRAAIRQGMAYISGDRGHDGVITDRPILENVTPVHFLRNRLTFAFPGRLRAAVLPALQALRTKYATLSHPISSLSGGNQQKIVIARWLTDPPQVLLLDDPTKGIDLATKTELFALIRELAEKGMAIILYSSEDSELLTNADRILVFSGGAIARELTGADRTRYNLYHAAYEAA